MVSAFASFFLGIFKFFSNFSENYDKFYESTEEYLSKNIVNGKVIYDIGNIEQKGYKAGVNYIQKEYKSNKTREMISATNKAAVRSSKIPIVHTFILLIAGIIMLFKKYPFIQLSIILMFFPLSAMLINIISRSQELFALIMMPIFLIFVFIETGLIVYISSKESGGKQTLKGAFISSITNFYTVVLIFLLLVFIVSSLFLFLIYSGNLLMFVFIQQDMAQIVKMPIVYFIVLISLFLVFGAIYIFLIFTGAIYTAVTKAQGTVDSLIIASHIYKNRLAEAMSIFLIYGTVNLVFLFILIFYLSDFALLYGLTVTVHIGFLFVYLFNRYLWASVSGEQSKAEVKSSARLVFTVSIFIGVIGYIAFLTQALNSFPKIESAYSSWQVSREIEENTINFKNTAAGYSLRYPKDWQVYTRGANSVTLHKNVNNTKSGELVINIVVRQDFGSDFDRLDSIAAGTVISNLETGEDVTKLYNMVVAGFETIKYRTQRPVPGYTEQKIVYLIKRGEVLYEIGLTAKDSVFLQDYSKVLDSIISSFRLN